MPFQSIMTINHLSSMTIKYNKPKYPKQADDEVKLRLFVYLDRD